MNPLLAQIYGTGGFDKTASEDDYDVIDLEQISGADLLAGVESGQIILPGMEDEDLQKEAGEYDIDLSEYTGQALLDALEEIEGGDTLDKMASDGSIEYWDMAGRVMAHAYADEMSKVASDDDWPEYIDPEVIDGETMVELLDSGAYELVQEEDFEKEAGVKDWLKRAGKGVADAARGSAEVAGAGGRAAWSGAKRGAGAAGEGAKKGWAGAKSGAKKGWNRGRDAASRGGAAAKRGAKGGFRSYTRAMSGKDVKKSYQAFRGAKGAEGGRDAQSVALLKALGRTGAAATATGVAAGGAAYGGKKLHDRHYKRR